MNRWQRATAAAAAVLAVALPIGAVSGQAGPAAASPPAAVAKAHQNGYSFAVIGDIPYGDAQIATFPSVIAQINADRAVRWIDHLGDIKSGSSVCSDTYFRSIMQDFAQFRRPLVYTVGDNEWTDCHRPNNGAYNPLERLATIRQLFFAHPGETLGQHPARVTSQADQGVPENVRWERAGVSFAALHIVGSNNGLVPWTGNSTATPAQTAEVLGRTAAVITEIHAAFDVARRHHDRAVTLLSQADMFDPTVTAPAYADYYAFTPIVAAIARESAAFRGQVYLFNGDSHVYNSDQPLVTGSRWLDFYGVTTPADNLSRVTIDGSTSVDNYLRVTVNPHGRQVLRWTRVPFTS